MKLPHRIRTDVESQPSRTAILPTATNSPSRLPSSCSAKLNRCFIKHLMNPTESVGESRSSDIYSWTNEER